MLLTEDAPARDLYALVGTLEAETGAPSVSYCMGFPAADIPMCGPVVWAYGDTPEQAAAACDPLNAAVVAAPRVCRRPKVPPTQRKTSVRKPCPCLKGTPGGALGGPIERAGGLLAVPGESGRTSGMLLYAPD